MSKRPRTPEVANAVRDAMVDAATRVFAKKGFAAATMKEIAVEAGYTAPAFYNYFAGKEELYEALLARTFEEIIATLVDDAPVAKRFGGRLEALMRRQFALADRRTDTFRVLLSAQVTPPEPHPSTAIPQQPEGYQRLMALLTAWFADAAGSPRVGRLSAKDAALVYLAVTQAFHLQWMTERPTAWFVDQVEAVRDVFLHGVGTVRAPGKTRVTKKSVTKKSVTKKSVAKQSVAKKSNLTRRRSG